MAKIIDGKEFAKAFDEKLINKIENLYLKGIMPTIGILRVGENPGDLAYERGAVNKANKLGIKVEKYICENDISTEDLIAVIKSINENDEIHGLLMLRPLPPHIDEDLVRNQLDLSKDLDCITDLSLANVFTGAEGGFPPCTAEACIELLKYYNIEIAGRNCLVIGRSTVIGKPVAMMLLKENGTVTICHSRTPKDILIEMCKKADIVIVAAGKRAIFTKEMAHKNQVVIDVGINVNDEGKLCGDVDYKEVEPIVAAITPVPGGVGSVTTSMLMSHLITE